MLALNLPEYPIKVKDIEGKKFIFDDIRRQYIALTPEEWVRQSFLNYLINHKGYPRSLMENETIIKLNEMIDIPIILTVVSEYTDIEDKIKAGVDIVNISGAAKTSKIVREIREKYPDLPIIATGGPTDESILETIEAGANAITYTPPTNGELFALKMVDYREAQKDLYEN